MADQSHTIDTQNVEAMADYMIESEREFTISFAEGSTLPRRRCYLVEIVVEPGEMGTLGQSRGSIKQEFADMKSAFLWLVSTHQRLRSRR